MSLTLTLQVRENCCFPEILIFLSGNISFSELLIGLSCLGEGKNSEKMIRLRFKAADLDKDGHLTFVEARKLSGFLTRMGIFFFFFFFF